MGLFNFDFVMKIKMEMMRKKFLDIKSFLCELKNIPRKFTHSLASTWGQSHENILDLGFTPIDDATLQLVPYCYMFKMPHFEEQNVIFYIFKNPCCHQSFQQKLLDGHSCSSASMGERMFTFFVYYVSSVPFAGLF